MRETSIGLGVIQVIFTLFIAALLTWLALGLGLAFLVGWGIFHLMVTLRKPTHVTSPAPLPNVPASAPPASVLRTAPPTVDSAAVSPVPPIASQSAHGGHITPLLFGPGHHPAHGPVVGQMPPPPPGSDRAVPDERERTNWPGLAAVAMVSLAGVPFLLGRESWPGIALAAGGAIVALIALGRATNSRLTHVAMVMTAAIGASIFVIGAVSMWTRTPTTLYGTNWGERRGDLSTIEQYQQQLPCVDEPAVPAEDVQEFYTVDIERFTATASCRIHSEDGSLPVVFVQTDSPEDLDRIFASGALIVERSSENEMWVQRDGSVAVITADEVSGDLAQDTGTTWIQLSEDSPRP